MFRVLTLFGTRPEVIKLAPVIRAFEDGRSIDTINVSSSQHTSLLYPFTEVFDVRIDHDLQVMRPNQSPDLVCSRVLAALNPILTSNMLPTSSSSRATPPPLWPARWPVLRTEFRSATSKPVFEPTIRKPLPGGNEPPSDQPPGVAPLSRQPNTIGRP